MIVCSAINTCTKSVSLLRHRIQIQIGSYFSMMSQPQFTQTHSGYISMSISKTFSGSSSLYTNRFSVNSLGSDIFVPRSDCHLMIVRSLNDASLLFQTMNGSVMFPKRGKHSKIKSSVKALAYAGVVLGVLSSFSRFMVAHAEAGRLKENQRILPLVTPLHGKKVFVDYSVIGIPGDGRCLFRSIVHGACLRSGKPAPSESFQRELADELRANVADEFLKRREETKWFIEGDFDTYVSNIREPHAWGGEPELLMASHVLGMAITVYMYEEDCGGLISIAEYGQEYGKDNPIRILYHGFGHYDALQIPGKPPNPRL